MVDSTPVILRPHSLVSSVPRGLAMLIIADGLSAGSRSRTTLITRYLDKIAAAPSFNALRLYIAPAEIKTTPLVRLIQSAGLTVVADTIDTVFRTKTPEEYSAYIATLYDLGVRLFCIDDAHRYTLAQIQGMSDVVRMHEGAVCLMSSGAQAAQRLYSQQVALALMLPLETQIYVEADETQYIARWTEQGGMSIAAMGCYATRKGGPLPSQETLEASFKALNPIIPNLSVYGHDENTDFRKAENRNQWKALCQLMDDWRCRKQPVL